MSEGALRILAEVHDAIGKAIVKAAAGNPEAIPVLHKIRAEIRAYLDAADWDDGTS